MSQRSKKELLEALHPRYLKANKIEKQKILDEFTVAKGYYRKYTERILKHEGKIKSVTRGKYIKQE